MKRFLCKLLLLTTAFAIINLLLLFAIPKDNNAYLCEYNHKLRLLERTPHPAIIFVGGSNIAFGINSKTISDSLHYSVVNFGLNVGLGIRYPVEDCLPHVKAGDVVVLQFEYSNFFSGGYGEPESLAALMMSTSWRNFSKLDIAQRKHVVSSLIGEEFHNLGRLLKYPTTRSFDSPSDSTKFRNAASGFNAYGDEVSHFLFPPRKYNPIGKKETRAIDPQFLLWLQQTAGKFKQAGVRVVMLPPVCIRSHLRCVYNEQIEHALDSIQMPYAASPSFMALDDRYVFNMGYHVNREGCHLNTQHIIKSLKPLLSQQP